MSTMALPRDLLKWLQSLDLTWSVRAPKWEMSNGFLVAEIFSWYFPQDVDMHLYHNASSLKTKLCNWHSLKKVIKKHKISLPDDVIDATIHCKDGAAFILLRMLYELLTNRQLNTLPPDPEIDFTDHGYQGKIPIHARSTAIQAVRNNLKFTELLMNKNFIVNRQKAQSIIERHTHDRDRQRIENPERFDRKPTLGELARRQPPRQRYDFDSGSLENVGSADLGSHVGFSDNPLRPQSGKSKRRNRSRENSGIRKASSAAEIGINQSSYAGVTFADDEDNGETTTTTPLRTRYSLSPTALNAEECVCGPDRILCECCNNGDECENRATYNGYNNDVIEGV